jgi:hypothetical protein
VAAVGLSLDLRRCNTSACATLASVRTGADGRYQFTGVPALGSGEYYYVRYLNDDSSPNPGPGYLYSWSGAQIAAFVPGSAVSGGDFDVADVTFVSPPDGSSQTLPVTFCWAPRGIANEYYRPWIYVAATGEIYSWSQAVPGPYVG